MDEKTDALPIVDDIPVTEPDMNAEIVENNTDSLPTVEDSSPAAVDSTDSFISSASTDTVPTNTETLVDTLISETSSAPAEIFTPDALIPNPEPLTTTSTTEEDTVPKSEDPLIVPEDINAGVNETVNDPPEELPAVNTPTPAKTESEPIAETVDLIKTDVNIGVENEQSSLEKSPKPVIEEMTTKPTEDVSTETKVTEESEPVKSSICQLEEELKRLHEGDDPTEEESKGTNLEVASTNQILNGKPSMGSEKLTSGFHMEPMENKPIMRDSDLEEMLSADDVMKDADLIQQSQKDIQIVDLLVCGRCHDVFHYVEEFQKHKLVRCNGKSNLVSACENEKKPQVWGFTLWKNKQLRSIKPGGVIPSSWAIYQKWCKLPEVNKNSWISAGHTLQFCNRIGSAKVTEMKSKMQPQKAVVEKDPLALDGFAESNKENSAVDNASKMSHTPGKSVKMNKDVAVSPAQKNLENSNKALRTVRSTETKEYAVEKIVAKRFNPKRKTWEYQVKWEHFKSEENTWEPVSNLNHCKQMVEQFEEQLKKLKMEKAKQAASMAKIKMKNIKDSPSFASPSSSRNATPSGRPQRTSKQKALNQVKAWCGNISDDDEVIGGVKRSFEDDDSDDSFEKKMKYEEFSEDSEEDVKPPPKLHMKKEPVTPKSPVIKNGIGKSSPTIPQNILIPDANGIVRINQKQLPSLSTGVYIMSKTAGIIKLDSRTSKVATSGGQTIVKVAPKIGQTQIKIVKKDGSTTTTQQVIKLQPKPSPQGKPAIKPGTPKVIQASNKVITPTPTKVYKPIITKVKRLSDVAPLTSEIKKIAESSAEKTPEVKKASIETAGVKGVVKATKGVKDATKLSDTMTEDNEDSDDGLEELPFPEEIKIPEPESPPGDFVLDPFTGKIAGVEYPDVPDPEPMEEEKSDSSLDNIVKLAAADITEEDLKNDPGETPMELEQLTEPEEEMSEKDKVKNSPLVIRKTDLPPASTNTTAGVSVVRLSLANTPRRGSSILNRALTGSQGGVTRKTIVGPSPSPRVQQRILNQTVSRTTTVMNPVVRPIGMNYSRTKPMAPKPKYNIAGPSKIMRSPNTQMASRGVYSYTKINPQPQGLTRKIGSTTIRSTPIVNPHPKTQARIVQTSGVNKYASRKESLLIRGATGERRSLPLQKPKPKTVISMPSLIGDEESMSPITHPMSKSPLPLEAGELPQHDISMSDHTAINAAVSNVLDPIVNSAVAVERAAETAASETSDQDVGASASTTLTADMSSFTLADSENPIFITGDDGTVYQVAGQNEQGQTILLTQGADGQQQCLLVTNELAETTETNAEEPQEQPANISMPEIAPEVTEPLAVKTDEDETSDQVVAQVVRAEPPSPGGTHKVVVMLPDGNLMVTQVSPEEYASLELD